MSFFNPEDCDLTFHASASFGLILEKKNTSTTTHAISLDKANQLLKERGKVVYGQMFSTKSGSFTTSLLPDKGDWPFSHTHRALLINIEPLEAPDSLEKVTSDFLKMWDDKAREMNLAPIEKRFRTLLAKKGE